jgi:hypothetical protein
LCGAQKICDQKIERKKKDLPNERKAKKINHFERRRDRTCNLLIRSQAPCHWASRPVWGDLMSERIILNYKPGFPHQIKLKISLRQIFIPGPLTRESIHESMSMRIPITCRSTVNF